MEVDHCLNFSYNYEKSYLINLFMQKMCFFINKCHYLKTDLKKIEFFSMSFYIIAHRICPENFKMEN